MSLPRRRIAQQPVGTCVRIHPCHIPELSVSERKSYVLMGLSMVISALVPEDEVHLVDSGGNTSRMPMTTTLEEMAESVFQSELMTMKRSDREES